MKFSISLLTQLSGANDHINKSYCKNWQTTHEHTIINSKNMSRLKPIIEKQQAITITICYSIKATSVYTTL